ncbi:MAG: oligosaccharide flippase family protein [Candidatus Glassbacteria bacterium]
MFYDEILQRLKGKTARDVVTVFIGNSLRSVLSFISNLIAIRLLGPAGFGTVASANAAMTLTAQATDFGLTTSSVRCGSMYLEEEPERTELIFKVTFSIKLMLGLPVLILLVLLSPSIATGVFGKGELSFPLMIAFSGSFCFLLASFPLGILQTYRRFGRYLIVAVSQGVAQLVLVVTLIATGRMEPAAVVIAFAAAPFCAFAIGWLLVSKSFIRARGEWTGVAREILGFGKWVTISTFATMFIMRLDILMLTAMSTSSEVGRYASANQLAYLFPLITGAMTTALLPKATGIRERHELQKYVIDTLRITPFAVIVAVGLLIFAKPVIGLLFTARYLDAVPIFTILLLSFLLSVILNPASLALYTLDRADLLAYLNLAQLVVNFAGNLILIPMMGGVGAALSSLAVRVLGGIYIVYCLRRFLFKGHRSQVRGSG